MASLGGVSIPASHAAANASPSELADKKQETLTQVYLTLKNEDTRFEEYLPCKVTVSSRVKEKMIPGQKKALVGAFERGVYLLEIEPTPPPGEELGPVPISENDKFRQWIAADGKEVHIIVDVFRKEAIEHNIMMTFFVEEGPENENAKLPPVYETHAFNYNHEAEEAIVKYTSKYNLNLHLVHAVLYMETTHGFYDAFFDYLPGPAREKIHKSIRPMNINVQHWDRMLRNMGLNRDDFYVKNWFLKELVGSFTSSERVKRIIGSRFNFDTNLDVGCFLLDRIRTRAKDPTVRVVAALYNFLGTRVVNKYGIRVEAIYNEKSWE